MLETLKSKNTESSAFNMVHSKTIGYFDKSMYRFIQNGNENSDLELEKDADFTPFILIVGRGEYHEVNKSYPLDKVGEIKKLIKLEYEGRRFHFKIVKIENGKSLVNIWIFSPAVPSAFVTLPESYLYAKSLNNKDDICVVKSNPVQFVAYQNDVLHSQLSNGLICNADAFAMSIGMSSVFSICEIDKNKRWQSLVQGFNKLLFQGIASFVSVPKSIFNGRMLFSLVFPSVLLGIVYLVLSSAYVASYKWYLTSELAESDNKVDKVLSISSGLENKKKQYKAVNEFLQNKGNIAGVWYALPSIIEDVELNRFDYSAGRFILTGQTARATDVLQKLSNSKFVVDAKFQQPTRTSRDKEYFSISFAINTSTSLEQQIKEGQDEARN